MSIFNNDTTICISCDERIKNCDIARVSQNIGICKRCFKNFKQIPHDCAFEGSSYSHYVISAYYYNDYIKNLIHRYKFKGEWKIGDLISDLLCEYITGYENALDFDFITSVPLSYSRMLKRGYNQSELPAKAIGQKLGIPYVSCIYKKRDTIAQSLLNRIDRLHNNADAYIADVQKVIGKRILLCDDVLTTGSTLHECAKELSFKGAEFVACITFSTPERNSTGF